VPAGNPDGGQWTDEGLAPTLVQSRSPREGRTLPLNLTQETRLQITLMQMKTSVQRAQSFDRHWQPRPQLFSTIEGQIRANEATRLEAELRTFELTGRIGLHRQSGGCGKISTCNPVATRYSCCKPSSSRCARAWKPR
jgi:hypothetical protein